MIREQFEQILAFFRSLQVSESLHQAGNTVVATVTYFDGVRAFPIQPLYYKEELLQIGGGRNVSHLALDFEKHDWPANKDNTPEIIDDMVKLCPN